MTRTTGFGSQTPLPARGAQGRVLFVEDDAILIVLGRRVLEALGYHVTPCASGRAALAAIEKQLDDFDVVITDVDMPGCSGFELAQRVRELRPGMPVVVVSGHVGPAEKELTQVVGAREILVKPVAMSELERTLARVLGRAVG